MPRPANTLWTHATKHPIPGRSHPKVSCNYCHAIWTTREVARIRAHLARCVNLPGELVGEFQPQGRVAEGEGVGRRKGGDGAGVNEGGFGGRVADYIPFSTVVQEQEQGVGFEHGGFQRQGPEATSSADWIYQSQPQGMEFQLQQQQQQNGRGLAAPPEATGFHVQVPAPGGACFESREAVLRLVVALQEYTIGLTRAVGGLGEEELRRLGSQEGWRVRRDCEGGEGGVWGGGVRLRQIDCDE